MLDVQSLNPPQRLAATEFRGPMMILAGAGTGKTRVITFRIAYMLSQGVSASEVVAVTFTNKAAREMKERVRALVGEGGKKLTIGTFHSFCLKLLRSHPEKLGLDSHFSLIGTSEQLQMITRALEEKGWHGLYKAESLLARISNAKNALLGPKDLLSSGFDHPIFYDDDPATLAVIYDLYERQLKLNRVIDFDDCIYKTVELLRNNPETLTAVQNRFRYFLVDEFQDTNFAQLSVLELLAIHTKNICVVGDDDQSIYSWRGALTSTLERFEEIFKGTRLVKLEQNYRCSNIILSAANSVIKNNRGRKEKTLWSTSKSQTAICLSSHPDDQAEARWIAKRCFALLGQGFQPRDIGILYRANTQARAVELALREFSVRYKVFGGNSFFERKEVKDFLSYLRLTFHPHDRMSFWRIINTPARGLGLKSLEKIEEYARQHNISPFEVVRTVDLPFPEPTVRAARAFIDAIDVIRNMPSETPEDLKKRGEVILKSFQFENEIRQKTSHEGSRLRKLESLRKLPDWLFQLSENFIEEHGALDLKSFIDQITLSDDGRQVEDKKDGNHVSLMTIHAAKGLEFPCVFLCGVEEDLLPHKNSVSSDLSLQEERRLFYVAITRAKEKLHLSLARERYSTFQRQQRKPSRFLEELPDDGIEREEQGQIETEVSAETRKDRTIAKLASLRSSLKSGFQVKPQ